MMAHPRKEGFGCFYTPNRGFSRTGMGDNSPPLEVETNHVALFATPVSVASRAFQRELAF